MTFVLKHFALVRCIFADMQRSVHDEGGIIRLLHASSSVVQYQNNLTSLYAKCI